MAFLATLFNMHNFLAVLILTGYALSLRVEHLKVPQYIIRGEDAHLICHVDPEGEVLYSLKWYKDGRLFYQYIPANTKVKHSYDVPSVKVDMDNSDRGNIQLRDVQLSTSGEYRCEAITEAPTFRTVFGNGSMTVVIPPGSAPVLEGCQESYQLGSTVDVNCTSYLSKPASHLTWFINDRKVNNSSPLLKSYKPVVSNGMETVTLGLQFTASRRYFPHGELKIKCIASIGTIYYTSQERMVLTTNYYQQTQAKESRGYFFFSSGSVSSSVTEINTLPLFVLLSILMKLLPLQLN